MSKSAQEVFDAVVAERNALKKEVNKWIYFASKMERERDALKELVSAWSGMAITAIKILEKRVTKKDLTRV